MAIPLMTSRIEPSV